MIIIRLIFWFQCFIRKAQYLFYENLLDCGKLAQFMVKLWVNIVFRENTRC